MASTLDVAKLRKHFPALDKEQVYFDNAGGSQVLQEVVESVSGYLSSTNVQLGASYPIAQQSTRIYTEGEEAVAKYINASPKEINSTSQPKSKEEQQQEHQADEPPLPQVLGPSTTQLFRNLSLALYEYLTPGTEIILSKLDHEANVASWLHLARWRQLTVKWWDPTSSSSSSSSKTNPRLDVASLTPLLSPKTKLVACTHTSNILGSITDVAAIAAAVHAVPGALLAVDAVAYAPHRAVDVRALGADFYAFSWYKVYGPHVAVLFASQRAQDRSLTSLAHYFKQGGGGGGGLGEVLGLAGASYELVAGIPPVCAYLAESAPWTSVAAHEERLQGVLLEYLAKRDDVQVWGEPGPDAARRVPVVSFTVQGRKSRDVVEAVEGKSPFGFRWGSFYSNRLVQEVLGLDPTDGVVRVSLVHYNTEEEVRGFVKVLDEVLNA
ncbi:hypothetical protein MBLNU459_g2273t1 [Dothideomycetes sp. NU459]